MTLFDPFTEERQVQTAPAIPEGRLKDLDLDRELYIQYHKAKTLFEVSEYDQAATLSGKVSSLNGIIAILTQITKLQADLYNAKTISAIENSLIQTLKEFPEMRERFLELYKSTL